MSIAHFKTELFTLFARIGKALGHAHRLEILEYLAQQERSVDSLAAVANLTLSNTSQHLQQLKQAGLVSTRKEGQQIFYRLTDNHVINLLHNFETVAERYLAEVKHLINIYLNVRDKLEPIPARELLNRVRKREVTVIDVRPQDEYSAGHLPGAVNIPLELLEQHLHEFEPNMEIVAYCRGPYCILAYEAVAKLREYGLKARRLENGFPEWIQQGLPVEHDQAGKDFSGPSLPKITKSPNPTDQSLGPL